MGSGGEMRGTERSQSPSHSGTHTRTCMSPDSQSVFDQTVQVELGRDETRCHNLSNEKIVIERHSLHARDRFGRERRVAHHPGSEACKEADRAGLLGEDDELLCC